MLDKQARVVWFNCLENLILCLTTVYDRDAFIRCNEIVTLMKTLNQQNIRAIACAEHVDIN